MRTTAIACACFAVACRARRARTLSAGAEESERLRQASLAALLSLDPASSFQIGNARSSRGRASRIQMRNIDEDRSGISRRDALQSAFLGAMVASSIWNAPASAKVNLDDIEYGPDGYPIVKEKTNSAQEDDIEKMKSITSLQQMAPGTLEAGGGTMSSRSPPQTGVVLLEPPAADNTKRAFISAELVCDGGVLATATLQSEYPYVSGMYYDVETKNYNGDGAFLSVVRLPEGKTLEEAPAEFFVSNILKATGRFGAYGSGSAGKIKKLEGEKAKGDKSEGPKRMLDFKFEILSPIGVPINMHGLVTIVQPPGSPDAVMLVGNSEESNWDKAKPNLQKMSQSFKIARVKPTKIKRDPRKDYRAVQRGLSLGDKALDNF